jgi:hypothetical protein
MSLYLSPSVVISAYHPVLEKRVWATDCDEEVGFVVQGCDAEDSEPCCGCGPVSSKCRLECDLWTSPVVCTDLCCATDAEVSDQHITVSHNGRGASSSWVSGPLILRLRRSNMALNFVACFSLLDRRVLADVTAFEAEETACWLSSTLAMAHW